MPNSGWALVLALLTALPVRSQDPAASSEERLRVLEQQNQEILDRLRASEARNATLQSEVQALKTAQADFVAERDDQALETQVNALAARWRDGVTFKDLTRSGNPIKFYGFIRLDLYYDQARMNSEILPMFVLPENGIDAKNANDGEFAMDARLTRFGFEVNAGQIGSAEVKGKVETDFSNSSGLTESRITPRIRLAYVDLDFGDLAFRLGQDWDVIAPLFPGVNGETLMWNAGNLGDRRPQAQVIWNTGDPAGTEFELRASAAFASAIDGQDLDSSATRPYTSTIPDGWDAGYPAGELRLGLSFPSWVDGKRATLGAWGYVAGLETDTKFHGEDHFTAWVTGIDWSLPLFSSFALRGEAFLGEALADVRGGIAQSINTTAGSEIQSVGGWAEIAWQATDAYRLSVGASIDNPDNGDLPPQNPDPAKAASVRTLNWTLYLANQYSWGGGLKSGLDVIYWETAWVDRGIGNTFRIDIYTQLDF